MPAQTLTSTQRAVLSPRNVNAPITSPSSKMGSKASSVTEQRKLVDVSARNALEEGAMPDAVDQQAGLAGTKRRFDISGGAGSVENKRRKAEGHAEATQSADDLLLGSIDGVLRGAVSEVLSAARAPRVCFLFAPYLDSSLANEAMNSLHYHLVRMLCRCHHLPRRLRPRPTDSVRMFSTTRSSRSQTSRVSFPP